ncbi:MAG TPA: hypothetical protein ENN80_15675, partial [Candidatus Hydrogenedentes bacterium]|nr:hypothetical protein [Candidatus Hydrogenedentota bacterium]
IKLAAVWANPDPEIYLQTDAPEAKPIRLYPSGRAAVSGRELHIDISDFQGALVGLVFDTSAMQNGAEVFWQRPRILASQAPPEKADTPEVAAPRAKNVIVIVLAALRADALSATGYLRPTTPHIDALADEGSLFERIYAPAPYTYSATWSVMTGLYQFQHKALRAPLRPPEALPTLPKVLEAAGVTTGCVTASPWMALEPFREGFTEFHTAFEGVDTLEQQNGSETEFQAVQDIRQRIFAFLDAERTRQPELVTDQVSDFLRRHHDQRFFLYAHYLQPCDPYFPPEACKELFTIDVAKAVPPVAEALNALNCRETVVDREGRLHLRARYDESLLAVDFEVGRLLKTVEELGIADDTAIIVTSDHGEAFGEHGYFGHNLTVYDEMVHVPLVMRGPGIRERFGARVDAVASTVDLFPTICGLLGIEPPEGLPAAGLFGESVSRVDDGIRACAQVMQDEKPFEAFWWPRYKLIRNAYDRRFEIFDLECDPHEQANIAPFYPVLADSLRAQADQWLHERAGK